MKRILIGAVAVVILLAGGWAGMWFLGKGEIEQRIDLEVATLGQQGWVVKWDSREIAGFPDTYQVALSDVMVTSRETGAQIRIGDIVIRRDDAATDRIVAQMPAEIGVALPVTDAMRAANPMLPAVLTLTLASENLIIGTTGVIRGSRVFDASADLAEIWIDQDDFAWRVAANGQGLRAALRPADGGQSFSLQAKGLAAEALDRQSPQRPETAIAFTDASITSFLAMPDLGDLVASLAAAPRTLDGSFVSGGHQISFNALDGQAETRVIYRAGAATGLFKIAQGVLDYQAEERGITIEGDLPSMAAGPGTLRADIYQRRLKMPVIPTQRPVPGALRIWIGDAQADDNVWQQIDPAGKLNRDPMDLLVDLETTQRLTPGGPMPIEFANVSVKAVTLKALGAEAGVTGDVEILQPIALPIGDLRLRAKGANAVLRQLMEAGLIPFETLTMGEAILQVYAKPGDAPDSWVSELSFENTGMTLNGLPVPPE